MEQGSLDHQPAAPATLPPTPAGQEQGQALEADVQAHLGRQLRAVYDEMASQPVPDRFIELLDALERKSQRKPAAVAGALATKAGGV